jgi:hypothetical protein
MTKSNKVITLILILLSAISVFPQIKREREESPPGIEASNTMGFGNVWMRGNMLFLYRENSGSRIEPHGSAGLGLANNLAVWGGAVIFEGSYKRLIGKADAHVKATLPYNDNLRFFGFGIQGDLVLSSDKDTFSTHTDTSRPAYTPIIGFTAMADFEIIKLIKTVPLKIYLNFSTTDDDRLLSEWNQQSYRFAVEWKSERNCFYGGAKFGRYTKKNPAVGEVKLTPSIITSFAGLRFRPIDRIAVFVTGIFSIPLAEGPDYVRYGLTTGIEMPLFFRETNAEAIRSLVMMENSKTMTSKSALPKARPVSTMESLFLDDGKSSNTNISETDSTSTIIDEKERAMQERRRNIDDELKNIENLLE